MAKKALLIGIHYDSLKHLDLHLGSAYQDVDDIKAFLGPLGFQDITILKDDVAKDHPGYPSRDNVIRAIQDLVAGAEKGDHLVFHFSGHGSQQQAVKDEKEEDGKDEAIWPADVEVPTGDESGGVNNIILDDDIKAMLVDKAHAAGATLIFLDCCHSGTGADLEYSYMDSKRKIGLGKLTQQERSSSNSVVVSWAACQDPHTTISFSESGGYFVKAFIETFRTCLRGSEQQRGATHGELLRNLRIHMEQKAEEHLEAQKSKLSSKDFKNLEELLKQPEYRPEPVLGILSDEETVLAMPVKDTFGS